MCNCSKPISQTDCQRLLECMQDSQRRTFIYHTFTETPDFNRLEIAHVPKDQNPNDVAKKRGFLDDAGNVEWFYIHEHPCLYE